MTKKRKGEAPEAPTQDAQLAGIGLPSVARVAVPPVQSSVFAHGEHVELRLYGEIGDNFFGTGGITAKGISEQLQASPAAKLITVRMSSPGGSVWEGMAIRSMLAMHPARVEVDIEGLCASAATLIAMAGDKIRMHTGSSMMIHEGSRRTMGDLREHQRAVALLEAINDGAASVYAQRCGKPKEEMQALMSAETWLTPEAAKDLGLCDEVAPGKTPPVPLMTFDVGRFGYRNVPPQIAAVSMQLAGEPQALPVVTQPPDTGTGQLAVDPPPETNTMEYTRIAMALGLTGEGAEEAAVLAAVNGLNKKLSQHDALMSELRQLTGKSSSEEMLGTLRGLQQAAEAVKPLQEQLSALDAKLQEQERNALIAQDAADPKGRKLTPALVKHFQTKTAAELRSFLEVAPVVVQMSATNTEPPVHSGTTPPTGAVTSDGKTWEKMTAVERHNLYVEDREQYDAIRADFQRRKRGV